NVEQAKVAVERQQMENRQQFAEAGIQLEVQKLSIQASRDVQMEFARALASFLSNGHMSLYGTPETAAAMLDNMAKGFGLRAMVEGFVNGTNGVTPAHANGHSANGAGGDAVNTLLSQIGGLLQPAIAKVTGGDSSQITPELAEQVARSLADNPAFLTAVQDALTAPQPKEAAVEVLPAAKNDTDKTSPEKAHAKNA